MAHTIFILGDNAQQCRELREILQAKIADAIVTSSGDNFPNGIQESDTVIITSEEKNTGVLYRRLLNKLEVQVHRAQFLGEMLRMFSSSHEPNEIVEQVAMKSTEVLGDTAFVVLVNDSQQLRLDAAHSSTPDTLVKILMAAVNAPHGLPDELLRGVLEGKKPCLIENLQKVELPPDVRVLVEKFGFSSLIATPIQTNDYVLGAFISVAKAPRVFDAEDLNLAVELSDFAAISLENASLFKELQRSAITDSLTGLYNTRFFNEVLGREAARADRYATPLALLMIDVDSFKLVNDTYGHVVGNNVLTQIGKALQKAVRNTDFVFRCGGDEFGVLLPATGLEGALHAAENILMKIDRADILKELGYSGPVTVSIGVSEFRRGTHYESMVAEADQALYNSKRSSKNCARAFRA